MVEAKAIQAIVKQAAIQEATSGLMLVREADRGPRSGASTTSLREVHRQTSWTSSKTTFI